MRTCGFLGSCAALLLLAAPASAQLTVLSGPGDFVGPTSLIDFDGHPEGTAANSLYNPQGVTFRYDTAGSTVPILDWAALSRVTETPPNVIATVEGLNGSVFSDFLDLIFAVPIDEVGMFFGNDQGLAAAQFPVQLSVFDASDALIGFTTVLTNQNTSVDQFIGVRSTTPFARARVTYLNTVGDLSVTLDNVEFTLIPEPGTGMLLGLGLVALARRRP